MHLYLLRHAEAGSVARTDRERTLTPKGHAQAKTVGGFCARRAIRPELILASPYRRTVQTAEHVTSALGEGPAAEAAFLASGMEPETALAELGAYQRLGSVLFVGHQPDLGLLAARLLGPGSSENLPFGKAALACLDMRRPVAGGGSLEFFVPVEMMEPEE